MIKNTPPMGWNSWNTFGADINEQLIKDTADKMAESGLLTAGYTYLVIDDCWSKKERDENGRLVADPEKFPNGMRTKPLSASSGRRCPLSPSMSFPPRESAHHTARICTAAML